MEQIIEDPTAFGIHVVDRRFKSADESVTQLCDFMYDFCQLNRRQRINLRNRTERLSDLLDWNTLVGNYVVALEEAEKRAYPETESLKESLAAMDFKVRKGRELGAGSVKPVFSALR